MELTAIIILLLGAHALAYTDNGFIHSLFSADDASFFLCTPFGTPGGLDAEAPCNVVLEIEGQCEGYGFDESFSKNMSGPYRTYDECVYANQNGSGCNYCAPDAEGNDYSRCPACNYCELDDFSDSTFCFDNDMPRYAEDAMIIYSLQIISRQWLALTLTSVFFRADMPPNRSAIAVRRYGRTSPDASPA